MKKYRVTLYYHTNIEVEVDAKNPTEAIELAREYVDRDDEDIYDLLVGGLEEDSSPDVQKI